MTFTLPEPTALIIAFFVIAVLAVGYAAYAVGSEMLRHRALRVRRDEGVRQYYGQLVTGH